MIYEYSCYDFTMKDIELVDTLKVVTKFSISSVSVLPSQVKVVKSVLNPGIKVSTPVDYPFGVLDLKSRLSIVENAVKNKTDIIEVVCPAYYLSNRKYDKFREDIKTIKEFAIANNVEVRYVLEYRQFTYELLYKVAHVLKDLGVDTIYPSTSYFLDDISDNLLASALINKKVPDINIIVTGNIWNNKHVTLIKNSQIYGIRLNSFNGLKLLCNNTSLGV